MVNFRMSVSKGEARASAMVVGRNVAYGATRLVHGGKEDGIINTILTLIQGHKRHCR